MLSVALLALAAYCLGAVPFGYLVARARHVDLTAVGSGNIGSTNIYRALGLKAALLVFALDAGKGFVGTRIIPLVWQAGLEPGPMRLVCAMAVVLGSVASVFLRFRGGKGVATGAGAFLGLAPMATGISIAVWAILVALTRYVSLASLVAATLLPILLAALDSSAGGLSPVFYLSVAVAVVVFVRHRSNLRRLLAGRENRVGRVKPASCGGTSGGAEGAGRADLGGNQEGRR